LSQSGIGAAKAQSAKALAKRMFFLKPILVVGRWMRGICGSSIGVL
jgi:hypothetical protein